MTDGRGLSIFDDGSNADQPTQVIPAVTASTSPARPPAPATGAPTYATLGIMNFPMSRRGGYDKDAVDHKMQEVSAERTALTSSLTEATASLTEARKRVADLEAELQQLKVKATEVEKPSYAGLGGRASEMLRLAEEQADEVMGNAKIQAAALLEQASRDAAATRAAAVREADEQRTTMHAEIEDHRSRTTAELDAQRKRDQDEVNDMRAAAQREADQLKLSMEKEAEAQRMTSAREADKSKAAADREVHEARRALAVERNAWRARRTNTTRVRSTKPHAWSRKLRSEPHKPNSAPARPLRQRTCTGTKPQPRPRVCSPAPSVRPSRC